MCSKWESGNELWAIMVYGLDRLRPAWLFLCVLASSEFSTSGSETLEPRTSSLHAQSAQYPVFPQPPPYKAPLSLHILMNATTHAHSLPPHTPSRGNNSPTVSQRIGLKSPSTFPETISSRHTVPSEQWFSDSGRYQNHLAG